jgi:small subunit ribosomal protein S9
MAEAKKKTTSKQDSEEKVTKKAAAKKTTTKKEATTSKKTTKKATTTKKTAATKKSATVKKPTTKKETAKATKKAATKAPDIEVKKAKKSKDQLSKGEQRKKRFEFSVGSGVYHYAVGKRKTAIARVRVYEKGSGKVEVNGKDLKDYFYSVFGQNALSPLKMFDSQNNYDITAKIIGGGFSAQSDALRNAIAKALTLINADYRLPLKKIGYLTRDSRVKERKKPGLKRARRAPQWQKR